MNIETWKDGIYTLLRLSKIAANAGEKGVSLSLLKSAIAAQVVISWSGR